MKSKQKYMLKTAIAESRGNHVFALKCGAIGSPLNLFRLAKLNGFDGSFALFFKRLHKKPDATLIELSAPVDEKYRTRKTKDQTELKAAMRALDERKAAMR